MVSIVIPALNEEAFLPFLLKDLSQQTKKSFEVIIVDGNSEDKTVARAQKFNDKIRLTIVSSKKRNLSFQRNLGARHAKGEYVVFIDADIRVYKTFVADLTESLEKKPYLIALPYLTIQSSDIAIRSLIPLINSSIELSQRIPRPLVTGGCMIVERNFFSHIGGFSVRKAHDDKKLFSEDIDLVTRAKKIGVSAVKLSKPLYEFSMRRYKREGWLTVLSKYFLLPSSNYEMGGQLYSDK